MNEPSSKRKLSSGGIIDSKVKRFQVQASSLLASDQNVEQKVLEVPRVSKIQRTDRGTLDKVCAVCI